MRLPLLFAALIACALAHSQSDISIKTEKDAFTGDIITTSGSITWNLDHKYGGNGLQFVAHKNNDDLFLTAVLHTKEIVWIRTGDNMLIKMADGSVITVACMVDASSEVKSMSLFTAYPLYRISEGGMRKLAAQNISQVRIQASGSHIDFLPGRKSMPDDCRIAFASFCKQVLN